MLMSMLAKVEGGVKDGGMIEVAAEWRFSDEVVSGLIGFGRSDGEGGMVVMETFSKLDVWELLVYYWLEIFLLVGLVMLVGGLVGLRRRKRRLVEVKVGEAYCGKCGYGLTGLGEAVDECPECGSEGVGSCGKRRKVLRRGAGFGKSVRWAAVVLGFISCVMMGVLIVGEKREWDWLNVVSKKVGLSESMNVTRYVGGPAILNSSTKLPLIRRLGAMDWFNWESAWAHRMLKHVINEDVVKVLSPSWYRWAVLKVEDGEVVREVLKKADGGVFERELIESGFGNQMYVSLMRLGGWDWLYLPKQVTTGDEDLLYRIEQGEDEFVVQRMQTNWYAVNGMLRGFDSELWTDFGEDEKKRATSGQRYEVGDGVYLVDSRETTWIEMKRNRTERSFYVVDVNEGRIAMDRGLVNLQKDARDWERIKKWLLEGEKKREWMKAKRIKLAYKEAEFVAALGEAWKEKEMVEAEEVAGQGAKIFDGSRFNMLGNLPNMGEDVGGGYQLYIGGSISHRESDWHGRLRGIDVTTKICDAGIDEEGRLYVVGREVVGDDELWVRVYELGEREAQEVDDE
ncbi:hypothetical protein JD969_12520 [Planctomycetota bacterium]|nr:hypothetical protein JD969_12520 [Planctomycetota bacterium]